MKGKPIRIVCVGKLKQDFCQKAWEYYLSAARKWRPIEVLELRDAPADLPPARRVEEEGKRIAAALGGRDGAIPLSENGRQLASETFADFLRQWDEREGKRLSFIIGGPYGLAQSILNSSAFVLSLSAMTWPHELARVLLMEQIFRAMCILGKFPYHH